MTQTFLVQFYSTLGISLIDQPRLHEGMHKLIIANVTTMLLTELSESQTESFRELIKSGKLDNENIDKWLIKNGLKDSEDFALKITEVIESSVKDFFDLLVRDLSPGKKQELLALAQSFLKE
jgi:predicted lactoylglutathione lyase